MVSVILSFEISSMFYKKKWTKSRNDVKSLFCEKHGEKQKSTKKIDEKIEFYIFVKFDEIFILSIRFENSAKFNREKFYRIMNSKRYFDESQQNFELFLRECVIAFQIKFYIYKKSLIRVIYV